MPSQPCEGLADGLEVACSRPRTSVKRGERSATSRFCVLSTREIVETDDLAALCQQSVAQMRPDEAGSSGDADPLG